MNGTKKPDPMTKAQVEHLQARAKRAADVLLHAIPKSKWEIPEPAKVTRARKLVKEWDGSHYSRESERRAAAERPIRQMALKVGQEILFADPRTALKAVEALERKVRP